MSIFQRKETAACKDADRPFYRFQVQMSNNDDGELFVPSQREDLTSKVSFYYDRQKRELPALDYWKYLALPIEFDWLQNVVESLPAVTGTDLDIGVTSEYSLRPLGNVELHVWPVQSSFIARMLCSNSIRTKAIRIKAGVETCAFLGGNELADKAVLDGLIDSLKPWFGGNPLSIAEALLTLHVQQRPALVLTQPPRLTVSDGSPGGAALEEFPRIAEGVFRLLALHATSRLS
jgi:hypothetical protein